MGQAPLKVSVILSGGASFSTNLHIQSPMNGTRYTRGVESAKIANSEREATRLFAIRELRMYNAPMRLKPQDVVVALKLCAYGSNRPPFAQIAADLAMSPSEVHSAVKRAQAAHLLHGPEMQDRPNVSALEEFLIHGVKYAFPAERGGVTRGLATSYAAEPLNRLFAFADEPIPVWPYPEGNKRGIALAPLYRTVPEAALRDPLLYELLALVDAIRDGRTRERKLAEQELSKMLHGSVHG